MKLIMKIFGMLFVVLVILFFIMNIDSGKNPGDYTLEDLPPVSYEKDNGFYRLWTLEEPADADVTSDKVLSLYRRKFDPVLRNKNVPEEWRDHREKNRKSFREMTAKADLQFPKDFNTDLVKHLDPFQSKIKYLKVEMDFLLRRYEQLMKAEKVQDFTPIGYMGEFPDLLGLLRISKLYTAVKITEAVEGDWNNAVQGLIEQVKFCKKLIAGSRILITNLIGKAIMNQSIYSLSSLMNQKSCPTEIYAVILASMPPLQYEEFGSRIPFISEYLGFSVILDEVEDTANSGPRPRYIPKGFPGKILFQRNRTMRYVFNHISKLVKYEAIPPYRWDINADYFEYKPNISGPFWWFQNGVGKTVAAIAIPSLKTAIYKSYMLKSLYDLTRISAELHLRYTPEKSVEDILPLLEAYKIPDPCSGQPYLWNQDKKILYGIGPDRIDNRGHFKYGNFENIDFAIHCVPDRQI